MTVIVWLARIIVASIFILFAYGKIEAPLKFAEQIQGYQMVPLDWTHTMAFTLPWLEMIAAVLLLVGLWRAEARFWILFMLVVFTIAKTLVEMKGMKIDCGCSGGALTAIFGPGIEKSIQGVNGIYLNVFLIALLLVDVLFSRTRRQPRISIEGQPATT